MQIILVSRHLKAARTITIMPRHLAIAGFAFVSLVIATAAATNIVPLSFELGGKSPLVVFDDADLDLAVEIAVEQELRALATEMPEPGPIGAGVGVSVGRATVGDTRVGMSVGARVGVSSEQAVSNTAVSATNNREINHRPGWEKRLR